VGREKDPEKRWSIEEFRSRLDAMILKLTFEGALPATPMKERWKVSACVC